MRGRRIAWYQALRLGVQILFAGLAVFSLFRMDFALLVAALCVSLVLGPWFCGWLCPLGSAQEWLAKAGRAIFKRRLKIPSKAERFLFLTRYVLLAISFAGWGFSELLSSPYRNFISLLAGKTAYISIFAWLLLGAFLAASAGVERVFCRYFCLEGAKYGLLSLGRVFTIRRDAGTCSSCGACDRACPSQIRVSARSHVRHPACVNCFECVSACRVRGALRYSFFWMKKGERLASPAIRPTILKERNDDD